MDKPICYGKYPSKDNPGRICRGCPVAQDCKKVKPEVKKVKPEVKRKPSRTLQEAVDRDRSDAKTHKKEYK